MKKIKTIINDKNKYFDYRGERCIVIHNPGVMNNITFVTPRGL